ncbi:DUF1850 domain-containing protein [Comamonas sp. NLF-1-9]|uniref:DUF1850 domain-containing protein n=1 Tax=Comamonas sp. NLF-1-9 TaxID=2853163 RepID=UPI001C492F20|nr:DUF1850 domain-containing protein [Comamonas sp. NLF-1-9]QXL85672.1 DUF1850 domain-containing protein [Comamonas sp. NLF-1-9]
MALGICLALAAAAHAAPVFVPGAHFTLAWTHSIEKQRWEEDYLVHAGPPRLEAGAARIRGSAAGMEPPPDARLVDGWYRYQPARWPQTPLRLTRSEFTADFDLCTGGSCRPMAELLPSDGGITLLSPCAQ